MSDYKKEIMKKARTARKSNELRVKLREFKKMQIDGQSVFFHGDIAIQSWFSNPKVDVTQKVFFVLLNLFTLESNRDISPEERINIQNTKLMELCNVISNPKKGNKKSPSTVQKALRYLTKMGVIEDRIYLAKGDRYSLKDGVQGLTNRRIILNLKRSKEFLRAIPGDEFFNQQDDRSRERRLIYRRPLSLVDHLSNQATSTQVNDINAKKNRNMFNQYLEKQLDVYNYFVVSDVEEIVSSYDDSGNLLGALYKLVQGDLIPPELMTLAS
ncbi:hypothetical protein N7603_03520 [Acholeplasma vituli]|uniref:Uncharacterized protein n=1 Tax=Paracholeplasma vituli TaxID=69473 RepID=A0ABT2PWL7_9MOLU|nr:hypothetical protein [Paracholeplasma vituli]MCU0104719.1 hypothetical protein [Paracholeplasma vituli]